MRKQNKLAKVLAASAIAGLVAGVSFQASADDKAGKGHKKPVKAKADHKKKGAAGADHACKEGGGCNHPEGHPPVEGESKGN